MPLMTLKAVADEIGLKSEQSVRNLAARGQLTIVYVQLTGEPRRTQYTRIWENVKEQKKLPEPVTVVRTNQGSPRIDSADVEAYKARLAENARSGNATAAKAKPRLKSAGRNTPRRSARSSVPPALRQLQRPGALRHFE